MTSPYVNPVARRHREPEAPDTSSFHAGLPGFAPTRLVDAPSLAAELRVGRVLVKEESSRLGLPAFKILGASYAVSRALGERLGLDGIPSLDALREALGDDSGIELVAATDGNHGRAVAHMARVLGLPARVFAPAGISDAAITGIRSEGAQLTVLDLPYDNVVETAIATAAESGAQLIQDSGWDGYESVPQWIVDGYSTLFVEADRQAADAGAARVDLVAVPVGVGSLAETAVRHYRSGASEPTILSVEPTSAPCLLESLHAGRMVSVQTGSTVMAGLNCGTPSASAWAPLLAGVDAAVEVTDAEAITAVRDLAALGIDSGPCGASTLAGVRAVKDVLDLGPDAVVLLISTESLSANPLEGRREG